jgi:KaiC/GvpD/RAD55 family RecA-like ATPase
MTSTILRFGIPNLDRLLGRKQPGNEDCFGFSCPSDIASSICLIGPHGTGKSVLALHLAAQYFADSLYQSDTPALVFYVSTDLSFSMAEDLWYNFALDTPGKRIIPFQSADSRNNLTQQIMLKRRTAHTGEEKDRNDQDLALASFLAECIKMNAQRGSDGKQGLREISFVDLVTASAGDDWGFIERLIAVLNQPLPDQPRHLIIVDAVEGLETRVGEKDAFGETTSRRARIAQLLRTASSKCHVLFIAEETEAGERVPEEFVSDVVIRLRSVHQHGFDRRMIQVEKVRGQSHVRGQHPYIIRSGVGSSTGMHPNWDDPVVPMGKVDGATPAATEHNSRNHQAYFHVIHSLHLLTRDLKAEKVPISMSDRGFAKFGITDLDSMLGHDPTAKGLPHSTVTALVGEAGTHKTALGQSFLSQGVMSDRPVKEVGILLTTDDIDADALARTFRRWNLRESSDNKQESEKRPAELLPNIICRRIEIHNQTSEEFMHIIRAAVVKAKEMIGIRPEDPPEKKCRDSGRIRLVIDDFSILRSMYADIREDSLFLPFLISYLKRERVTALIIKTHPGHPYREGPALFDDELQALADNHLFTWRVQFHGEFITAISAIPPICSREKSRVRELLSDFEQLRRPEVDRRLELYTGLEHGNPEQVPLEVRLYAETDVLRTYLNEMNALLGEFYGPINKDGTKESKLVVPVEPHEYSTLHDFCNLQADHSLDHTLILQVDEFWALSPPSGRKSEFPQAEPPLRAEDEYLNAKFLLNDPLMINKGQHRRDCFSLPGCGLTKVDKNKTECAANGIDRIPMMWDFGFLLCRESAWDRARKDTVEIDSKSLTVEGIWNELPSTSGQRENAVEFIPASRSEHVSWRKFLGACQVVSRRPINGEEGLPFDLSMPSGESFSSLLLELWASEIVDGLVSQVSKSEAKQFIDTISQKHWTTPSQPDEGLVEWLHKESNIIDFYMGWLLLVDLLPFKSLVRDGYPLDLANRPCTSKAVASRHWYKTACEQVRNQKNCEPMFVAGLPGHFSVRGDWFLGVARGSKSDLLADRVLDLFTTRRNNFTRLYQGIGLPARVLGGEKEDLAFLTALQWKDNLAEPRTVRYEELLSLGSTHVPCGDCSGFHWLWRSALRDYHTHARIFQRWNSRTVLMWNAFKAEAGSSWKTGFAIYDELSRKRPRTMTEMDEMMKAIIENNNHQLNTWEIFKKRCDLLAKLLAPLEIRAHKPVQEGDTAIAA